MSGAATPVRVAHPPPVAPRAPVLVSEGSLAWLRAGSVLVFLAPVTLLLGLRLAHLRVDPLLGLYGVVVLATTSLVMFIAFGFYRDPAMGVPTDPRRAARVSPRRVQGRPRHRGPLRPLTARRRPTGASR